MLEKFSKVDNPLTIIAIFAGITEVASSVALPFLDKEIQGTFVWFLILFPLALITAFFLTLNLNTKALYAPADYRDDKHFLQALSLSTESVQVSIKSPGVSEQQIAVLQPKASPRKREAPFDGLTEEELDAVNTAFQIFSNEKTKLLFDGKGMESLSFGIHGEGIFVLIANFKDINGPREIARVIRATTIDGKISLRMVGRGLSCSAPSDFAELIFKSIEGEIEQRSKSLSRKAMKPTEDIKP